MDDEVVTLSHAIFENYPAGPEPRVLTEDVQAVLRLAVKPGDDEDGESVSMIAEKADTSTRTVYRVLSGSSETISLSLADRLCLAAGSHIMACRLKWPDGTISSYF